jgi:hypothetical protein
LAKEENNLGASPVDVFVARLLNSLVLSYNVSLNIALCSSVH